VLELGLSRVVLWVHTATSPSARTAGATLLKRKNLVSNFLVAGTPKILTMEVSEKKSDKNHAAIEWLCGIYH
jgi:hypothetical protein